MEDSGFLFVGLITIIRLEGSWQTESYPKSILKLNTGEMTKSLLMLGLLIFPHRECYDCLVALINNISLLTFFCQRAVCFCYS